jgi:hypothetical protein
MKPIWRVQDDLLKGSSGMESVCLRLVRLVCAPFLISTVDLVHQSKNGKTAKSLKSEQIGKTAPNGLVLGSSKGSN